MNWNKLARWAGVTAFSVIIPAAAMAKTHHVRLTHSTTAPSTLTAKHVKSLATRKAVSRKLKTRGVRAKQLKATRHKGLALKSKKTISSKLVSRKHKASTLTAKKHVTSKLKSSKVKAHTLTSRRVATPVAPTM
jgi:hypothetical protein